MQPTPPSSRIRHAQERSAAIRAVAFFEAFKGALVLAAGSGLLLLVHRDVHAMAAALVEHLHLNPASHYPTIFLDAAANTQDSRLMALAAGAAGYATLRLVEAYGLYRERAWAEVLAAVSGAVYVPFEVAGLIRHPGWHGALLLAVNLGIVGLMVAALLKRRRERVLSPP
ncbi:DUF2127 domain-containing protein [Caenimonas terrae]|uniref:DUF2127 domain-containing protein n=1 Tax=Caenimonas terrae TaxID=696074 RepID=A0ABW0NJX8_9BURK